MLTPQPDDEGLNSGETSLSPGGIRRIAVSERKNDGFSSLDVSGRVPGQASPYFYGWVYSDSFALNWPTRDDLEVFVREVDRFRRLSAADQVPDPVSRDGDSKFYNGIYVVTDVRQYLQITSELTVPASGRILDMQMSGGPRQFSFREAGSAFWSDPLSFLREHGLENFLSVKIGFSTGDFEFQRRAEQYKELIPYPVLISMQSHFECQDLLSEFMRATHCFPTAQSVTLAALSEVISGYQERHAGVFVRE